MFASIETKGASHIIINIPQDGADKSLPMLARMLEENAVFINKGYSETSIVHPVMNITLGDQFDLEVTRDEQVVIVGDSKSVLSDDFVVATPAVFVSHREAMSKANASESRIRTELSFVKDKLAVAELRITELENTILKIKS